MMKRPERPVTIKEVMDVFGVALPDGEERHAAVGSGWLR